MKLSEAPANGIIAAIVDRSVRASRAYYPERSELESSSAAMVEELCNRGLGEMVKLAGFGLPSDGTVRIVIDYQPGTIESERFAIRRIDRNGAEALPIYCSRSTVGHTVAGYVRIGFGY